MTEILYCPKNNELKRRSLMNKLKRLFTYYGSSRMVADINGKPKGLVWFTICTGLGNFRLFPVGYVK